MRTEVTFTSDFGLVDPYVGEVKGVIFSCEPRARVTDITHGIPPGDLDAAAFVLAGASAWFLPGAVHLAVVDPGVGGQRDILVVTTANYRFVGPDNGILYEAARADGIEGIHVVDLSAFLGEIGRVYAQNPVVGRILAVGPSAVFHGRDLFAPLAAYLAGRPPRAPLGGITRERGSMEKIEIGEPAREEGALLGKIVYADRFGNLVSNIRGEDVGEGDEVLIKTGGTATSLGGLGRAYGDVPEGVVLPLVGSRGYLEIAVNRGSAKARFGAACGDGVIVLKRGAQNR